MYFLLGVQTSTTSALRVCFVACTTSLACPGCCELRLTGWSVRLVKCELPPFSDQMWASSEGQVWGVHSLHQFGERGGVWGWGWGGGGQREDKAVVDGHARRKGGTLNSTNGAKSALAFGETDCCDSTAPLKNNNLSFFPFCSFCGLLNVHVDTIPQPYVAFAMMEAPGSSKLWWLAWRKGVSAGRCTQLFCSHRGLTATLRTQLGEGFGTGRGEVFAS